MLYLDIFVGFSLGLFLMVLVGIHLYHIFSGQTVIELEFQIRIENSLTWFERLEEVFGPPSIRWILPVPLGYDEVSAFSWEKYRVSNKKTD
jgi:hypothetical protein